MKTSITITISLDDIKESIEKRYGHWEHNSEYLNWLKWEHNKSLDHLYEKIDKQIISFAEAHWGNEKEEDE